MFHSNIWIVFGDISINCEIELDLKLTKDFVLCEISKTFTGVPNSDLVEYEVTTATTSAPFQINNAKLHVSVATLSINGNIKLTENIKQRFQRKISWNKYRSQITTQTKINNWDYLIDPTFININRLFVISLINGDDDSTRYSFDQYYMPLVEIKDFDALTDNKSFFDQPVKNRQEAHEKRVEMARNDDYTTEILLDFSYYQNYYKLVGIEDLLRQTNTNSLQQINITEKLEEDYGANNVFYCW